MANTPRPQMLEGQSINTKAKERIRALEAEMAEKEKAASARRRVEVEAIMTNQLPGFVCMARV